MYLDDVPINYLVVFCAAVVNFIIGCLWYGSCAFGCKLVKQDVTPGASLPPKTGCSSCKCIGAYIGEFILSLVTAYVLTLFIEISQADTIVEGIAVAIWIWIGFIATTLFSGVLWGRKHVERFFIDAGFLLIGLIAMAILIMYLGY